MINKIESYSQNPLNIIETFEQFLSLEVSDVKVKLSFYIINNEGNSVYNVAKLHDGSFLIDDFEENKTLKKSYFTPTYKKTTEQYIRYLISTLPKDFSITDIK